MPDQSTPIDTATIRVLRLTPTGLRQRFLLVIPEHQISLRREERLRELGLHTGGSAGPAGEWSPEARRRITDSALAEACQRAGEQALAGLLDKLPGPIAGTPRLETLAAPPESDLILRVEVGALPQVTIPDPSALAVERLVAQPDPAELDRAFAMLVAGRASQRLMPPGTRSEPGDTVICDVAAKLLPSPNHIPQPGLSGAQPGRPGCIPDGWAFGDNGAGLAAEIVEVAPDADPPSLRLRVSGTAKADGQSYVIFHGPRAMAAAAGSHWVGSVMLRAVGQPVGLRACKLRLESQPASGEGSLRRKDTAVTLRGTGFARFYVSDRHVEPETAWLRMPLLFDHAAGPVDFSADIALPRLVQGLDLGQDSEVPLPEFSGRAKRYRINEAIPDMVPLAPHLAGIAAGETREIPLRLPDMLDDQAIAGRAAHFTIHATAILRDTPPAADDALAQAMGFADLAAMRGFVARRVAEHHADLAQRRLRHALCDALLAAAGDIPLPADAIRAECATLRPLLAPADEAEVAQTAARRQRERLLLGTVARRHGLVPDEGDLRIAAADPATNPAGRHARALEEAAIRFLLAHARITTREVPAAELAAQPGRP